MKPDNAPRLETWMFPTEIAQELGISRQTVNQMIHAGEFKSLHLAGGSEKKPQFAVRRSEVEKIAETRVFPRRKVEEETSEESPATA